MFVRKLGKFRSTELYHAPLEESTIFLLPSTTSRTPLDSSRLAELKYAFFSSTGRKTKKLQHLHTGAVVAWDNRAKQRL